MAGRPTSLTPELQGHIVQALAAGNTRMTSCQYAGIDYSTFKRWMQKGKAEGYEPYVTFRAAVIKAESDAIVRNVAIIQAAAKKSWQAAAWWLERSRPETYSRDQTIIRQLERQVRELERALDEREEASSPRLAAPPSHQAG